VLAHLQHRTPSVRSWGGPSMDDPAVFRRAAAEGLAARAGGAAPSEAARPFAVMTMADLARECLRRAGEPVGGLSPSTLVTRAISGAMTTSDFPLILADALGKNLRRQYESAPGGVRQLGRQTTARDFRAKHAIQLGEAPTLLPVGEHAEFRSGVLAEAKESYAVSTFGRIVTLTRQSLVDDDLSAFDRIAAQMGRSALEFERAFLADLLVSNAGAGPLMSDAEALFHVSHANLAASGAPPDETQLSLARTAMRRHVGLSGVPISVPPRYLLVAPELETTAEKLLSTVQATATTDVNVFSSLSVVVEPRLADPARWYLIADPAVVDALEFAHLEGEAGPQILTEQGFSIDGVRMRVRLDFGAGFVDWRSWYMNPGQ
jgi:hypothetical protein